MLPALFFRHSARLLSLTGACLLASPFATLLAQSPSASDGYDPNTNGVVTSMVVQADGKTVIGGLFTTLQPNGASGTTTRNRLARLNPDGTVDTTYDPNANNQVLAMVLQPDGKIVIGGNFTALQPNGSASPTTRNHIARLNPDGSVDTSFNPNATGTFVSQVFALALQPNGQILVGGAFTALQPNGAASATTRNHIARLNADGSLDNAFNPNVIAAVTAIAVQANGQILIGGGFTSLQPNGAANPAIRNHFARLNADGSLDGAFDPNPNGSIAAIVVQADNKVILGGTFSLITPNGAATGTAINNLARVNPDGSLDTSYEPSPSAAVSAIVLQPDGKAVIGGSFIQLLPLGSTGGATVQHIARLNPDGTLDNGFQPSCNGAVDAIGLQKDGRVVIGGNFTQLFANAAIATSARNNLARINPDGSLDATFDPDDNGRILAMAQQPDGKVLLGGTLTSIGGVTRNNLARINTNGALDTTFNPSINASVGRIVVQPDGRILILGGFNNVNGVARNGIARLNADGTLDTLFNPNPNGPVSSLALQSNGNMLIAGSFSSVQPNGTSTGTSMSGLARLNSDGTLDVNFPNVSANSRINVVNVQVDGKILISGEFTGFQPANANFTQRNFMARLNSDGTIDANFDPNFNNSVATVVLQSDGRILAGGSFTQLAPKEGTVFNRGHLARLNTDGTVDTNFDPEPQGNVTAIAVQPDGHVLITGLFTTVTPNLGVGVFARNSFARLNVDGSIDQNFVPNPNTIVNSMLVLSNGTFFAAGGFTVIANTQVDHLVQFNADGSLNTGFAAQAAGVAGSSIGGIAIQPDSRVLLAGSFNGIAGAVGVNLARFNPDSSPDTTFNANIDGPLNAAAVLFSSVPVPTQDAGVTWVTATGALRTAFGSDTIAQIAGTVEAVAVQSDGKVIVAGNFRNSSGVTSNNILRLLPTGKLDSAYNPNPNNLVASMALQPDGKLIIVGSFTSLTPNSATAAISRNDIARLNTDGTVDTSFDPNPNGGVSAVALQPDGKIVIGGSFSVIDPNEAPTSIVRENIARLNPDGTVDSSFNPNATGAIDAITLQPNGQILIGGTFTSFQPNATGNNITRNFAARLNADGTLDTSFDPEPNGNINGLLLQSDGKIILGGAFTTLQPALGTTLITRNNLARVNPDGSVDMTYDPNANTTVNVLTLEPNGEVLAGGSFTTLTPNGSPTPTTRNNVALINKDGTVDASFDPAPNGPVNVIALQPDGSVLLGGTFNALQPTGAILVGGSFAHVSNVAIANLSLLNADGSPNASFQPNPNGAVFGFTVQPDSRTVVAGAFTTFAGSARNGVARLNADNSLDASFNPNVNGQVRVSALQPNGQLVLGGSFTSVGGVARSNLARINADGSLDSTFNPNVNGAVNAAVVQPNGQVVLGGSFSSVGGTARANVARVNADGSLDTSFNPNANGAVNAVGLEANGLITLGGAFTTVGGVAQPNLARLNSAGTVDPTFTTAVDGAVSAVAFQVDGKTFIGGSFSHVNGLNRFRFARLSESSGASQSLAVSTNFNTATWSRGGSAPEISQVQFQVSTDAANWTNLGAGSRVGSTSNWQITGVSLPGSTIFYLRALGLTPTSQFSSSSLVQTVQQFDSATGVTGSSAGTGGTVATAAAATPTVSAQAVTPAVAAGAPNTAATAASPEVAAADVTITGARLITFSSRADVTADNPLVAGFTIAGPAPKTVLLRAVGPGLGAFGVQGVLANPTLQLYDSAGHLVVANAGWNGDSSLSAVFAQVGAFPFTFGSADAAAVAVLAPGSYTVQVAGVNGQTGAALAEVYDADGDPLTSTQQIAALTARSGLEAGGSLTGGFVVAGNSAHGLLVRASGPALGAAGLPAPVLSVYDSQGNLLARNAGWGNPLTVNAAYPAANPSQISAASTAAGASALSAGGNDSAVILSVPAGAYSIQVTDANGQPGFTLVEVYKF
jgi:uncharacterized delta-60 repeat protein